MPCVTIDNRLYVVRVRPSSNVSFCMGGFFSLTARARVADVLNPLRAAPRSDAAFTLAAIAPQYARNWAMVKRRNVSGDHPYSAASRS